MQRKAIFDTVRQMIGRGFRQSEVNRLDHAINRASHCDESLHATPRSVSERGIALVKQFEGCARLRHDGLVEAYPDPGTGADPWTIGWGSTGKGIARGTVWTRQQCDARLEQDLARYAAEVRDAIGDAPTTQAQFDALVSFHYNTGAIRRATLTRKHVAGDFPGARREFARWNRAGGRILKGLVRRRAAEALLYGQSKPSVILADFGCYAVAADGRDRAQ